MSENSMLHPESPVTGQTRMDSAWGSQTGDEDVHAKVTQASVDAAKSSNKSTSHGTVHLILGG